MLSFVASIGIDWDGLALLRLLWGGPWESLGVFYGLWGIPRECFGDVWYTLGSVLKINALLLLLLLLLLLFDLSIHGSRRSISTDVSLQGSI